MCRGTSHNPALYQTYNGTLYQVLRQSDGKTLDIGVIQPAGSVMPAEVESTEDVGSIRVQ
jgi:hypothetical protein